MSRYIQNKTSVVTGGADGIGFSMADKFLENGAKVAILVDINENKGKEAEDILNTKYGEGKADFIKCDVTKDLEATFNNIIDKYKYVDTLVNNAGVGEIYGTKILMDVNATAVLEWSLAFFELMKNSDGKGGTIINISSVLGYEIVPYFHIYQASKFAVTGFTRSLGHESLYALTGVRTISLCPGLTETNMTKDLMSAFPEFAVNDYEKVEKSIQTPTIVAEAAVEVLDKAPSGSIWSIIGSELRNVDIEIKYKF